MLCPEDMVFLSKCMQKGTDAYFNSRGGKAPVGKIILGLLTSPDYRMKDFAAIMNNGYSKAGLGPLKVIMDLDLREDLKHAAIPYWILQGDTDTVTPTAFVQELVSAAENENLRCTVVKNSGHFTSPGGMDAILESLSRLAAL